MVSAKVGYKLEFSVKATETFIILYKKVVHRHCSPIDPTLVVIPMLPNCYNDIVV